VTDSRDFSREQNRRTLAGPAMTDAAVARDLVARAKLANAIDVRAAACRISVRLARRAGRRRARTSIVLAVESRRSHKEPQRRPVGSPTTFTLFRVEPVELRVVVGFGRLSWVEPNEYAAASRS